MKDEMSVPNKTTGENVMPEESGMESSSTAGDITESGKAQATMPEPTEESSMPEQTGEDAGMEEPTSDECEMQEPVGEEAMPEPEGGEPGGTESGGPGKPQRTCATMDVHRRLLKQDPQYAAARARVENLALQFLRGERAPTRCGVVRIPVVVHVVWKTSAQNISDAQINSQIDVLNHDFRQLNSDISQVPSVWQSTTGDAEIEFYLANKDPDGNQSSGVTRTQTSVSAFIADTDDVKSEATGGVDAWPADRYLNTWVCPKITDSIGRTILGYAQFPGGPVATDGVVIAHSYFGTTGTATAPFNLGRTTTHEIGHWLNLYHIWGDDGSGCSGSDEVDDTPNQGGANYNCPSYPNISCNNGPHGDMFMNYMDYVDDHCMVMFTKGQVARMDACLEGPRTSFLTGKICRGRLEVFSRGTDHSLWHIWQTAPNNGWGKWASLSGKIDSLTVGQNADGRLEVFSRGMDSSLWHIWQTSPNNGWSKWASLGGKIHDVLAVEQNADGRLEVFARGLDHALWHKWQTAPNNGWSKWASLGGRIDLLAVARNADGRLEVFARGLDGALWHKWQTAPNNGWSKWASLGGRIDLLAIGQNADGRLEVFARGLDGALWHKWQTMPNNGWSKWASMGGRIDLLSLGRNADGRLEVFARGLDHSMWHKWQTAPNNGWSKWASLGGKIDLIEVGQNADGRLEIFARGINHSLWHKWQTAPNNGWSKWASMGGKIDMLAVANNVP